MISTTGVPRQTIGRLAAATGVTVPTIRFYERRGLIPLGKRSAGNYRMYPDDVFATVRFIKQAQEFGFSLKEIEDLLALRETKVHPRHVREHVVSKLVEINRWIQLLQRLRDELTDLVDTCGHDGGTSCPILSRLEHKAPENGP